MSVIGTLKDLKTHERTKYYNCISGSIFAQDILSQDEEELGKKYSDPKVVSYCRVVERGEA